MNKFGNPKFGITKIINGSSVNEITPKLEDAL